MRALEAGGGARRRQRAGRWAAVTALAAAVAATSLLVPVLIPAGSVPGSVLGRVAGTEPGAAAVGTAGPPSQSPSPSPSQSQSPSAAAFRPIRIAATDPGNERYGVETIVCPTCASGSRVQYVGQGHALVVHVRGIPSPGRRTLTIIYETNGRRPLDVIVNDAPATSLDLPGRDSWITPASIRLPVDLPAGDTVIRLFHAGLPAPDLDQIVIS